MLTRPIDGDGPTAARSGRRVTLRRLGRLPVGYLVPAVVILGAFSVYPLIQLVQMAFSDVGPTTLIGPWEWIGKTNFSDAVNDRVFWQSVTATAIFTAVLLVVDLTVGFLGAAVMSTGTPLTRLTIRIMVFVWALPPLVSGSVWKFLLAGNGAINTLLDFVGIGPVDWLSSPTLALWSVSLVAAWASVPFAILIIHGGMLSMPREVLEAARIDGAGFWQLTRHVIVPILRPTLTVLTILVVLYAFRSFDFVFVMTQGGPGTATSTLPYFAYETAFKTFEFGVASAIALISIGIVFILAIPYMAGVRKEQAE